MNVVLGDAGRAAIKAFLAAVVVLAPGIWLAPNLNNAYGLGIAALAAGFAAALAAVQAFVPLLSFRAYLTDPWGPMADSFVHAWLGAFIATTISWLNAPDLSTWRAFATGVLAGAFAAGFRALQGYFTKGEHPAQTVGVPQLVPVDVSARPQTLLAPYAVQRHLLPA